MKSFSFLFFAEPEDELFVQCRKELHDKVVSTIGNQSCIVSMNTSFQSMTNIFAARAPV